MNDSLDPGLPIVKRIANICAIAAVLPLIYLAEWVPGLLPRSPNLAYSSDPIVSSIGFPIAAGILSLLGFTCWWSLRRLNRLGLVTFAVFWLAILAIVISLTFNYNEHDRKAYLVLALLLFFLIMLVRGLYFNWRIALRSNTSLERTRGR